MKPSYLLLAIISALSSVISGSVVSAQCIQADIAIQYNISGSRVPTERNNDVQMQSQGSCRGNASITTGVQGNEGGTRRVRQSRRARHRFRGDQGSTDNNTVQVISNPTIDVYNAADNL